VDTNLLTCGTGSFILKLTCDEGTEDPTGKGYAANCAKDMSRHKQNFFSSPPSLTL
jgi:hypothetical protein